MKFTSLYGTKLVLVSRGIYMRLGRWERSSSHDCAWKIGVWLGDVATHPLSWICWLILLLQDSGLVCSSCSILQISFNSMIKDTIFSCMSPTSWRLGGGERPRKVPDCLWGSQFILLDSCLFLLLPPLLHLCPIILFISICPFLLPASTVAQVQKQQAYIKSFNKFFQYCKVNL